MLVWRSCECSTSAASELLPHCRLGWRGVCINVAHVVLPTRFDRRGENNVVVRSAFFTSATNKRLRVNPAPPGVFFAHVVL